MTFHVIVFDFIQNNICHSESLRIHKDKHSFVFKQNEFGVNCYSVHALKVPIYKIPFSFTINITELVHQKSFSKDAKSSVLVHLLPIIWSHNFSVQLAMKVLLEKLQVSTDLVQLPSVSTFPLRVPLLSKIELLLYLNCFSACICLILQLFRLTLRQNNLYQ
jgi:hypothetical protein